MEMKRRSKVETATVHIPMGADCTRSLYAAVLTTFIKHLLYIRGQIPLLYNELVASAQSAAAARPRAIPGPKKKTRTTRLLNATESLFDSTKASLFSTTHATSAFLLLGASSFSPREVYEFIFPAATEPNSCSPDSAEEEKERSCRGGETVLESQCRRILREMVVQSVDLPEGNAPERRCKAFVLLSVPGGSHLLPVAGFSPRRDWRLRQVKGTHIKVVLHAGYDLEGGKSEEEHVENGIGAEQLLWLQSTAKVQGLGKRKKFR